ncbi:MAG: fluoride efflux transporter CrcB [Rubrivivax sp.]|nr:fluoride efflux transporter CrcB [Rubrivivax sp.]
MFPSMLAVAAGAALGALLRWVLALSLDALFPLLPPGTLAANLLGGYLVGLAVAWLAARPDLPATWRLFLITGALGGLTTFSGFSVEVVGLLQQQHWRWAGATIAAHVAGSLAMTIAGFATWAALQRRRVRRAG